jgi:hypothetical protein
MPAVLGQAEDEVEDKVPCEEDTALLEGTPEDDTRAAVEESSGHCDVIVNV